MAIPNWNWHYTDGGNCDTCDRYSFQLMQPYWSSGRYCEGCANVVEREARETCQGCGQTIPTDHEAKTPDGEHAEEWHQTCLDGSIRTAAEVHAGDVGEAMADFAAFDAPAAY